MEAGPRRRGARAGSPAPAVVAGQPKRDDTCGALAASEPRQVQQSEVPASKAVAPTASTSTTALWIGLMCVSQLVMYTSGKQAMLTARLPIVLCVVQFGLSALLILVPCPLTGAGLRGLRLAKAAHRKALVPLCLLWSFSFVLLNASIACMSASLATAVRALEPLSALALGATIFGERYSLRLAATMLPICIGVAMTSYGGGSLSLAGFLLALASNFGFSSRAFLARQLPQVGEDKLDDASVYFNVCAFGCLALVPVLVAWEGPAVRRFLVEIDADKGKSFLFYLLLSSSCFFLYQFSQLVLMSKLSSIAFSVVTPISKAFVTVSCALYFGDVMTTTNSLGVAVSMAGVLLFSTVKRHESFASQAAKPKGS